MFASSADIVRVSAIDGERIWAGLPYITGGQTSREEVTLKVPLNAGAECVNNFDERRGESLADFDLIWRIVEEIHHDVIENDNTRSISQIEENARKLSFSLFDWKRKSDVDLFELRGFVMFSLFERGIWGN